MSTVRLLPGVAIPPDEAVVALLEAAVSRAQTCEALAALIGGAERAKATALARLFSLSAAGAVSPTEHDRLIDASEAARLLNRSVDYIYRNSRHYPFTVRGEGRAVRFSLAGLQRYIAQCQG